MHSRQGGGAIDLLERGTGESICAAHPWVRRGKKKENSSSFDKRGSPLLEGEGGGGGVKVESDNALSI